MIQVSALWMYHATTLTVEMRGILLATQPAGQLSAGTGFWVWRGLANEIAGHALS